MKNNLLLLTFNLLFVLSIQAQKDTSRVKLVNENKKELKSTTPIDAVSAKQRNIPAENINAEPNTKIDINTISDFRKNNKMEAPKQFVLEQQPKDKDILEIKRWMGKDVSTIKLKSNLSLGNINSKTKKIKIEFRDFGSVDGDRIKVYLNDKVIKSNVVLDGNYFFIYLQLEPGFNRIDFQALNEGLVGPNTVELNVFDDFGTLINSNHWNLSTNQIATLGVSYY